MHVPSQEYDSCYPFVWCVWAFILPFDYDLYLEIDYEGRLKTKLYDKRDDFSFQIVRIFISQPRVPNGEVEITTL